MPKVVALWSQVAQGVSLDAAASSVEFSVEDGEFLRTGRSSGCCYCASSSTRSKYGGSGCVWC